MRNHNEQHIYICVFKKTVPISTNQHKAKIAEAALKGIPKEDVAAERTVCNWAVVIPKRENNMMLTLMGRQNTADEKYTAGMALLTAVQHADRGQKLIVFVNNISLFRAYNTREFKKMEYRAKLKIHNKIKDALAERQCSHTIAAFPSGMYDPMVGYAFQRAKTYNPSRNRKTTLFTVAEAYDQKTWAYAGLVEMPHMVRETRGFSYSCAQAELRGINELMEYLSTGEDLLLMPSGAETIKVLTNKVKNPDRQIIEALQKTEDLNLRKGLKITLKREDHPPHIQRRLDALLNAQRNHMMSRTGKNRSRAQVIAP